MNWNKIKDMFIYLFLILNILLVIFYIYTVSQNKAEIFQSSEVVEKSLKADKIEIMDETNIKKEGLGYLNVTNMDLTSYKKEDNGLNYELKEDSNYKYLAVKSKDKITNINNKDYKEKLENFIIENLKLSEVFVFSEYNKEKNRVVFDQVIDGIRIFDNKNAQIIFNVSSSGDINDFTLTALTNVKKNKNEILSTQSQVINKMYVEGNMPKNSKVKITLGYYTYISQVENQVLIPTWKIAVELNDGTKKIYYVDAIELKILEKK